MGQILDHVEYYNLLAIRGQSFCEVSIVKKCEIRVMILFGTKSCTKLNFKTAAIGVCRIES